MIRRRTLLKLAGGAALALKELLPAVPLWKRFGNQPLNDKERVSGSPDRSDGIWTNGGSDNPISLLIMDGTLKPK